jgi:5-methylcytosine-specific restriction endonuclease McrA
MEVGRVFCSEPGCGVLVPRGTGGWCATHARAREQARKARQVGRRIYNSPRWKGLRKSVLRAEPWCRICVAEGRPTIATDIDHIIALQQYAGDPFDKANLQPLCARHHGQKTRREQLDR